MFLQMLFIEYLEQGVRSTFHSGFIIMFSDLYLAGEALLS